MTRKVRDAPGPTPTPKLDVVGSVLSATGLGLFVFGVLESSTWGWVKPKNSPITIFGFSLTLFVIAAGCVVLWGFVRWQGHREATERDPLIHLSLARIPPVRSGVIGLFSQNLILMGTFFVVPLYLQLVLGLNALDTGIKMLPISITMLVTAGLGARLSNRFPVRTIVRTGLVVTIAGVLILLATIKPDALRRRVRDRHGRPRRRDGHDDLPARQRDPVIGRGVGSQRGRRPAVHRPATRLGPRGGVHRRNRPDRADQHLHLHRHTTTRASAQRSRPGRCGYRLRPHLRLVRPRSSSAAQQAGLDKATTAALVDDYETAQLRALKAGLLGAALLALISLAFTRELPHDRPAPRKKPDPAAASN